MSEQKFIDWAVVEKDYRAGLKSLRQIAEENGITEGAIRKRAKRDMWTRNLEERIQQKAAEKVRKELVRTPGTQLTPQTEKQVVEEYSTVVSRVDLRQRDDVEMAMDNARGMLLELVQLSKPEFAEVLQWMALNFDESADNFKDKANEAYRYIISLSGRVKMAKELAGVHGVYVPLQRKMYKLDDDDSRKTSIDDLLTIIGT